MTRARRAVALLLILALAAGAVAQEPAAGPMDAGTLLGEAADLYRQADQLDNAGQSAAAAEALRGALLRYQRVGSSTGWGNGRLAYNAANTHLRLGDVGRAVLMYRRAAELIPGDRNVRQGLGYARGLRADRIDEPVSAGLMRVVLFWHYLLPTRTRAIAFLVLWGAVWAGVLLRMVVAGARRQRWLRPAGAACVLLAAALAGVARGGAVGGIGAARRDHRGLRGRPSGRRPLVRAQLRVGAARRYGVPAAGRPWRVVAYSPGRRP